METTIDLQTDQYGTPRYAGQRMTKADFLRWESDDNYVYEYNDGILEPTTSMKQEELPLYTNLENHFFQTNAFHDGDRLRAEVDIWLTEKQIRRTDVAHITGEQLRKIVAGERIIPGFAVKFVSQNDDNRKYIRKLNEYFRAGVQVVWLVFRDDFTVYVYTSPKTISVATDADVLSAAPALPELQMTVAELFQR